MKSPIIFLASLLVLSISLTSCDPFRPVYKDTEGQWEVSDIIIQDRTSFTSGEALTDTIITTLSEFNFAFCDKDGHAANSCDYSLTLEDGRTLDLIYHFVDAEERELVLGGEVRDIPDRENINGIYFVTIDEERMILKSTPNSSPFLLGQYQGGSITITLNRK